MKHDSSWFSKKVLRGVENTLLAYDQAILDLKNGKFESEVCIEWFRFGTVGGCIMCRSTFAYGIKRCNKCSLRLNQCDRIWCIDKDLCASYRNLYRVINGYDRSGLNLLQTLRARRKALLKRWDKNGITLK